MEPVPLALPASHLFVLYFSSSSSKQKGWLRCHFTISLGVDQGRCSWGKGQQSAEKGWRRGCPRRRSARGDLQGGQQPSELGLRQAQTKACSTFYKGIRATLRHFATFTLFVGKGRDTHSDLFRSTPRDCFCTVSEPVVVLCSLSRIPRPPSASRKTRAPLLQHASCLETPYNNLLCQPPPLQAGEGKSS